MVAEPVGLQAGLEFLVAVLAFAAVDGVLKTREGGLAGQIAVGRRAVAEQLEDWTAAQHVVVVLVGVVGEDP
jgi:hypothetical protein